MPDAAKRVRKLRALLLSKYDEVWAQAEGLGWTCLEGEDVDDDTAGEQYHVCWSDTSVSDARVMNMGRMARVNHFPGMLDLVRKAGTARNLNKMREALGKEYSFFPRTFVLPADYTALKQEFGPKRGRKTFILKPSRGAQGAGISLTRSLSDIDPQANNIVQRYMAKPHLIDGYKYDMRLFVLLTSLSPLRIYIFREGLVRLCTQPYGLTGTGSNLQDLRMHLTNYAINKNADGFVQPTSAEDDCSSKRLVSSVLAKLGEERGSQPELWSEIQQLCVKTIISAQPHLLHTYRTCRQRAADDCGSTCFELLGFDVILDAKLKPYLLEVNHSPSFTCDSPLDEAVKSAVLRGTMEMVSFSREEKKLLKGAGRRLEPATRTRLAMARAEYESGHADRLGFDTIFPPACEELHARYRDHLKISADLYSSQSLAGSRRDTSKFAGTRMAQHAAPHPTFGLPQPLREEAKEARGAPTAEPADAAEASNICFGREGGRPKREGLRAARLRLAITCEESATMVAPSAATCSKEVQSNATATAAAPQPPRHFATACALSAVAQSAGRVHGASVLASRDRTRRSFARPPAAPRMGLAYRDLLLSDLAVDHGLLLSPWPSDAPSRVGPMGAVVAPLSAPAAISLSAVAPALGGKMAMGAAGARRRAPDRGGRSCDDTSLHSLSLICAPSRVVL